MVWPSASLTNALLVLFLLPTLPLNVLTLPFLTRVFTESTLTSNKDSTACFISNFVDYEMDPQTSIDGPRSFSDQGDMKIEKGYGKNIYSELEDLGHKVSIPIEPIGGAQAILIDHEKGVLQGGSDPRKDGCALGY